MNDPMFHRRLLHETFNVQTWRHSLTQLYSHLVVKEIRLVRSCRWSTLVKAKVPKVGRNSHAQEKAKEECSWKCFVEKIGKVIASGTHAIKAGCENIVDTFMTWLPV